MDTRIVELEAHVAQLCSQKDELYRDIETLCAANGDGSPLSKSSVLMQRVIEAERSRDAFKAENSALMSEKKSLLEDLASLRESKHHTDAYCRELSAKYEELLRQKAALFTARGSRASIGCISLPDDTEDEGDNPQRTLQTEVLRIATGKENTPKRSAERMVSVEHESASVVNTPDMTAQLEQATEEIALLYQRIRSLEESLESSRMQTEEVRENARRSDSHVSTLLDQLEQQIQNDDESKRKKKGSSKRSSRSLQKKLDRLSLDLTRAFTKIQSKEDALSETEAELDGVKRRHSADMTLVREAFDMKYQETQRLIAQKDEMIQAQQHSLQLMELEKRKLLSQINRKDLVLSRMRSRDWQRNDQSESSPSDDSDRDQQEYQRKIDGMESKIKILEDKLHRCVLKQEATERQKNEALYKAIAYKKRFAALKKHVENLEDRPGLPLLESNLHFHNFSTEWRDVLNEAKTQTNQRGNSSSCRSHALAEPLYLRYSYTALAQFTLVSLMMDGVGRLS